jgi:hypothetical protein
MHFHCQLFAFLKETYFALIGEVLLFLFPAEQLQEANERQTQKKIVMACSPSPASAHAGYRIERMSYFFSLKKRSCC